MVAVNAKLQSVRVGDIPTIFNLKSLETISPFILLELGSWRFVVVSWFVVAVSDLWEISTMASRPYLM